ncbi:MAG: sorbosone dehydrogenase family protein [Thermoanaerobaculia bacterium]
MNGKRLLSKSCSTACSIAIALLTGVAQPRPATAISACSGGTCVACNPAVGGVVGPLIPSSSFVDTNANEPVAFVDPTDGSSRRLIATQEGAILIWDGATNSILATPFLDLRSDGGGPGLDRVNFGGERGLLALAVAPDYATSGRFYVYYTSVSRSSPAIPNGAIVVERFTRSANPLLADTTSGQVVLGIAHPASNHNGGWLAFGPNDGYLYVSTGDGGGGCDSQGPNAQNVNELLGKMLRIDVSGAPGTPDCGDDDIAVTSYSIPPTNPFSGAANCDEIWNYGLRNPFRFSFDRETGDIFIGDVGQDNWEEFDFQSASLAGHAAPMNFGWVVREGCDSSGVAPSQCGCSGGGCPTPNQNCQYPAPGDYWDPILCHSNPGPNGWSSGIGGYRYRGNHVPALEGRYLYSDVGRGDIWITTTFDPTNLPLTASCCWDTGNGGIYAFGEDHLGELYVVNGASHRIDCIHNGNPDGCFWAGFRGIFEDDFESQGFTHWNLANP